MDFLVFQYPMITLQACLDGILLGVLFALIAYGMALQWGVMNIINIAQGDLVILGGYIAYFMYLYGIHPAWGVIVAPVIMYFVGIAIYKLVINKVVDRDLFISILATFGISILFMQLMNLHSVQMLYLQTLVTEQLCCLITTLCCLIQKYFQLL